MAGRAGRREVAVAQHRERRQVRLRAHVLPRRALRQRIRVLDVDAPHVQRGVGPAIVEPRALLDDHEVEARIRARCTGLEPVLLRDREPGCVPALHEHPRQLERARHVERIRSRPRLEVVELDRLEPRRRARVHPRADDGRDRLTLRRRARVAQPLVRPARVDDRLARGVAQREIRMLGEPPVELVGLRLERVDVADVEHDSRGHLRAVAHDHRDPRCRVVRAAELVVHRPLLGPLPEHRERLAVEARRLGRRGASAHRGEQEHEPRRRVPASCLGRVDRAAEAALPARVRVERAPQVLTGEVGPEPVEEHHLGVRALQREEVRDALLAR